MNKPIRGPVINGDGSGDSLTDLTNTSEMRESAATSPTPTPSAAAAGLAAAVAAVTADAKAAAAASKTKGTTPPAASIQPAFEPPIDSPATARDEHHGRGGQYHIVDGKRVRVEPDPKL